MVVVVVDVLRTSIWEESEISTTLKTRIVKNKKKLKTFFIQIFRCLNYAIGVRFHFPKINKTHKTRTVRLKRVLAGH